MHKAIKDKKITRAELSSLLMLALLFLYMYALNYLMPLHRDDYEYALIWGTTQKISSLPDIFHSLFSHYLTHGGRMVDFFVLDGFLLLGKQWFNPFNALLFVTLIILIYWHSQRQLTFRFNPFILGIIILFCWLGLPDFALTNIWMTGSCVYLMTAVFILAFLLPYHFDFAGKPLLRDRYLSASGMFFGGLVASWTIENTAATMILIAVGLTYFSYRKSSLKNWMATGLFGSILGYSLLVIAPGNYVRYGQGPKLIFHITNVLGASLEILVGVIPIILFLILAWRILITDYAKQKGIFGPEAGGTRILDVSTMAKLAITVLMVVSLLNGLFVSKFLSHLLYKDVAIPLGIANERLKLQLSTTMSGLEEVLLILLVITEMYNYIFKKLALQNNDVRDIAGKVRWQEIMHTYPACYVTAASVVLAVINNLIMVAAPSFPGRAGFGSVVFLIIGAASLFTVPQIAGTLLGKSQKRLLALFGALIFIPMAAAVLYQHAILYDENNMRMAYVREIAGQGAAYLELEPLPIKNLILRHVYFVELNNGVSKYGFCRYYGLKDVKVLDGPKLFSY